MVVIVNIVISHKITVNVSSLLIRNSNIITVNPQRFTNKVFGCSLRRTLIQVITNALLQIGNKVFIPIRCDNCKLVNLLNLTAKRIRIHAVTILVYTKP
jgi:hypothetical protein